MPRTLAMEHRRKISESIRQFWASYTPEQRKKHIENSKKATKEAMAHLPPDKEIKLHSRLGTHYIMSEERKRHISEAKRGKATWNKGLHLSEEHKRKISLSQRGIKCPQRAVKNKSILHENICKARKTMALNGHRTNIELEVERVLKERGINFISEHPLNGKIVDFYIPSTHTVIEVDGKYWHRDYDKERIRDNVILNSNLVYDIIHLPEEMVFTNEWHFLLGRR